MCTDVDYLPQLMVLTEQNLFLRKNSWTPSISSNLSSTSSSMKSPVTSWFERKLFSHFKRFFRRQSFASPSNSSDSSRRTSLAISDDKPSIDENPVQSERDEQGHTEALPSIELTKEENVNNNDEKTQGKTQIEQSVQTPPTTPPIDSLYDYDQLLHRCLVKQEHHRTEMVEQCQKPVTIPHADLRVGHSNSVLINWKSYLRLFRALNRDPQLFQQYISRVCSCQTSVNQREQLILNFRTSQGRFDQLLRSYLDEYVTCFECLKAQTNLIRTTKLWRIECQFCGSQRTVQRLRWKRSKRSS